MPVNTLSRKREEKEKCAKRAGDEKSAKRGGHGRGTDAAGAGAREKSSNARHCGRGGASENGAGTDAEQTRRGAGAREKKQ